MEEHLCLCVVVVGGIITDLSGQVETSHSSSRKQLLCFCPTCWRTLSAAMLPTQTMKQLESDRRPHLSLLLIKIFLLVKVKGHISLCSVLTCWGSVDPNIELPVLYQVVCVCARACVCACCGKYLHRPSADLIIPVSRLEAVEGNTATSP